MFGDMGVFTRSNSKPAPVKWGDLHQKIQIEGPRAGRPGDEPHRADRFEIRAQLLDKVYKMHQIGGLNASSDIRLIKKIQDHTAEIQKLTGEMIDARKVANRIEDPREKAIAYPRYRGCLLRRDPPSYRQAGRDRRRSDLAAAEVSRTACSCADRRLRFRHRKTGIFLPFRYPVPGSDAPLSGISCGNLFVVAVFMCSHVNGVLHRLALRDRKR